MDNLSYEVIGFQEEINRAISNRRFIAPNYNLIRAKDNFFIWRKGGASNYIRLSLQRAGDNFFYWDLELSFKPFNYEHNHRQEAHIKSEMFKADNNTKAYNEFVILFNLIFERLGK